MHELPTQARRLLGGQAGNGGDAEAGGGQVCKAVHLGVACTCNEGRSSGFPGIGSSGVPRHCEEWPMIQWCVGRPVQIEIGWLLWPLGAHGSQAQVGHACRIKPLVRQPHTRSSAGGNMHVCAAELQSRAAFIAKIRGKQLSLQMSTVETWAMHALFRGFPQGAKRQASPLKVTPFVH